MPFIDKFSNIGEGRRRKELEQLAQLVNTWEPEIEDLSDDALAHKTVEFRQRQENGEPLGDILPEAFATTREAARRTIGQRHFDVQLMGGAALHRGSIAEMRTGEGKTLVSTLPGYLNAVEGKGVHLVTVNDYLAKRDSEWMGGIYRFLGLEVGLIQSQMSPEERRPAYAADIPYGTNNEFGFDYLRDNMAMRLEHTVQRGYHFAIVDEVDSILIDEARTPLIISGMVQDSAKWYQTFARIAPQLTRDEHYEVEEAKFQVAVMEAGVAKVEQLLNVDNRQGAVQARRRIRRPERRGEDRRRVHGPHPRGAPLLRGAPPGHRGEGGRPDQRGEPDARDDHHPELLQDVRQARRDDGYREDATH